MKKGIPHLQCVAVQVLEDWKRGKLPWFIPPPFEDDLEDQKVKKEAIKEVKEAKAKLEEQEILYQELPRTGYFAKTRDMFGAKDETEAAYRADLRGEFVGEEEPGGPTRAELKAITVANPLGLMDDDPLIIEAKKRAWAERRRKAQKEEKDKEESNTPKAKEEPQRIIVVKA